MGTLFNIIPQSSPNADWSNGNVTPYSAAYVANINDTTTTQKEITSIPSPFARIELVKEAFGKIVPGAIAQYNAAELSNFLHGVSIYHKTVSDTLDVAQIFFSYPIMRNKVQVLVWNRANCIQELLDANNGNNDIVGNTLNMFLQQDAMGTDPYNFGIMNNIYILKYIGPGCRNMHIIGATSPATLFFSTANDESGISKQLCFGTDYAFDGKYASLDQRDTRFIDYMFAIKYSYPNFAAKYPELDKYLNAVYNVLGYNLQIQLNNIRNDVNSGQGNYFNMNYDPISVNLNGTVNNVEVNGNYVYCRKAVADSSDFEVSSSKRINGKRPWVLPIINGPAYANLRYHGGPFGIGQGVPKYDARPLNVRTLPGVGLQYPYLTISDFLDDKIIKLPAEVDSSKYFDGNFHSDLGVKDGYLLPVLPEYFNYFGVSDLMGQTPSGKKTIEIEAISSGVEVTLRIPIQNGNEIEYKRIYTQNIRADKANNVGAIVLAKDETAIGVLPPVKFANEASAHYRVAILSDHNLNKQSSCEFHNEVSGFFSSDYVVHNVNTVEDIRSKVYFLDGVTFDCARVTLTTDVGTERQATGLMIPKFISRGGSDSMIFAIDLGTTNTHIEYTNDPIALPQPFAYDEYQPQMSFVCEPTDTIKAHIRGEFVPEAIGEDGQCHFPMRTVLCMDRDNAGISENGDNSASYVAFGNASPAFMYNYATIGRGYNKYIPNLKWSSEPGNEERIRYFIESLLLMIRTKVIFEGGDLTKTQIKWFYPVSMSNTKKALFQSVWTELYQKYFNPDGEPVSITESIAPYSFFQRTMPNVTDIVTVDIGGGTTDIVVADIHGVKMITSMRFAADAIFGNGLVAVQQGAALNGIVRQFKDEFIRNLNGLPDLQTMLREKTEGTGINSSEAASFLFSLKDNKKVIKNNLGHKADFNFVLMRDPTQKIVFYIFYTAIIYHLANLMRAKGLDAPKNIAFSGNGSRVVSVLSPDKKSLEKLTTKIFNLIYDVDVMDINLIINSANPKEATCKGGVLMTGQPQDVSDLKAVLLGNSPSTLVEGQRYSEVSDFYQGVQREVKDFMDFITLKLVNSIKPLSLEREFEIDAGQINLAKDCFNSGNLKAYIENGVNLKLNSREVSDGDIIEESLFFYPIIGVINDLSDRICTQELNKANNGN